jgi:nucleoside-diphosphate-sugar epimerase
VQPKVVLITGAAGLIGGVLRDGLADAYLIKGLDRRRVRDRRIKRADVTNRRKLAHLFDGAEAIIDLATAASLRVGWDDVLRDCRGRVNVLEAARASGAGRYILASSNHVTGLYEFEHPYADIIAGAYGGLDPNATPLIGPTSPLRPDGPYAVGKAFGEAVSKYYSDRYGLSCICLRIGSVNRSDRPNEPRDYATLLTHRDLVHIVDCALRAPQELRYAVYYGVSANRWRFWDIANAREEIGFEPQDDAERFRPTAAVETA